MLFSPFASPRRLALLVLFSVIVAFFFINQVGYSERFPKYDAPWSKTGGGDSGKGSAQQPPGAPGDKADGAIPTSAVPKYDAANYDWSVQTGIPSSSPIASPSSSSSTTSTSEAADATSAASQAPPTLDEQAVNASQPIPKLSYDEQLLMAEQLLDWPDRPGHDANHWPPYEWYGKGMKDYDPNRWEGFDWNNDFYLNNGIKALQQEKFAEAVAYNPYPRYSGEEYKKEWKGAFMPCEGPRGKNLDDSKDDVLKAYPAIPHGFPGVMIGDAGVSGVDISYCFDRYHKYGPVGFEQEESKEVDDWQQPLDKPDWTTVNWGKLQDQCVQANEGRWSPNARARANIAAGKAMPTESEGDITESRGFETAPKYHYRTALLIRTWENYTYTDNDVQAIRSLITDLSLGSGGEYQVFLFVNMKSEELDFWNDKSVYEKVVRQQVPKEFWDIAVLWNEQVCKEWYPKVGDWQVYWHQFMPLQWFSKVHPEFEYIWNWETDARFTGNHYQFLEAVSNFSRYAPRKYMWERSQRFYFPAAHGSYENWLNDTDTLIERAIVEDNTYTPVWGPMPYKAEVQKPIGPKPPTTMEADDFKWGVGEEADLITLQPIWDPRNTEWSFRNKIWNFVPGKAPKFTQEDAMDSGYNDPEFKNIPRRVYINTLSRFSKRQLHAMHLENLAGRTTQAEMFPATAALHHGLKAIYAPHPIWTDRRWPAWYLDPVFNADGNRTAQWGQEFDSPYNHDREHNFGGWSWYYQSSFPSTLYRRWLGWKDPAGPLGGQLGGPEFENKEVYLPESHGGIKQGGEAMERVGGKGRMCLPPMLLHPVKNVVEHPEKKGQ
ncbi:hypothetical protein K431DRAFT_285127 [Polychaeton citri CBS 116435]|uniref:Uncharacterized protein n=1 Tax=Polychaeton citri CBS 116435 TaxID=1314669 RepID=A0A9P4UQJ2_9PEZI|nr:hypothetical protein K431DRAFT_285127 [Polychaeton citri CBS 116435]